MKESRLDVTAMLIGPIMVSDSKECNVVDREAKSRQTLEGGVPGVNSNDKILQIA